MISSRQQADPADVAAHYDDLDYFYRDVWGDHVHHGFWRTGRESRAEAVRALVQIVAEEAGLTGALEHESSTSGVDLKAPEVCDIGCGYGATARLLAQEYAARVTAITVSSAQHAYAQSLAVGSENPVYLLGDWLQNTLPAGSFDAAIAIESSEHMPDMSQFFAQAHRVLRPGGRLVVCAWLSCEHPSHLGERLLLEPICREGRMPQMGAESDYRRLAEEAGFSAMRFQDGTREVRSTWPRIAWTFFGKLAANPRYLRFLLSRHARNRVFALTIFRLWLAYRLGVMRYGIFTFLRHPGNPSFDNARPAP